MPSEADGVSLGCYLCVIAPYMCMYADESKRTKANYFAQAVFVIERLGTTSKSYGLTGSFFCAT